MNADDIETFGAAVRRLRTARGLSLRQLNAVSHVDVGHLSKIENDLRPSTEVVAAALDNALAADGELIAIGLRERASNVRRDVASDDMRRRTLMTGAMATAFAGTLPTGRTVRPGRVGAGDAERLQRAVIRVRALGHQHGGEHLWQAAETVAKDGYHLLEHATYTEPVGEALITAIGRAQMLAGWLAFDSGQQNIARACYNEALSLARQTDNASIEVHALANLAFQTSFLGLPRQSMRFADAAQRAAYGDQAQILTARLRHLRHRGTAVPFGRRFPGPVRPFTL